jgi:hypothetical protein
MSSAGCINICRICYLAALRHERDDAMIVGGGGCLKNSKKKKNLYILDTQ